MKKFFCGISLYLCLWHLSIYSQELPVEGICAHRGANSTHPENTIAAFKEAVRLSAQMIEFDIRRTKDDSLVVIHNADVEKTTDGKGFVEELTFNEIRKLDAGIRKNIKFRYEKIPTFREVFNVIPKNIWMNIHIKGGGAITAEKVAEIITAGGYLKNSFIACDSVEMIAVRKINPQIKICYMQRGNSVEEYVDAAIAAKSDFIQLRQEALPDIFNFTKKLKDHGIIINYYYAKSKDELKTLLDAGVDFPLVNNFTEMIKYKNEIETETKR